MRSGSLFGLGLGLGRRVSVPRSVAFGAAIGMLLLLVLGASPALAYSDDSGWFEAYQLDNYSLGFNDVVFVDGLHGWAVGDGGTVRATVDGGATWKAQRPGITADLKGVAFSDARHGWVVAELGILATADGGSTWTVKKTTTDRYSLNDIACWDALHACAVGYDLDTYEAALLTTTDGGATWSEHALSDVVADYAWDGLVCVTVGDANHAWAAGRQGVVATTADGGATWTTQRQPVSGEADLNGLDFVDAQHGWAVGEDGTILVTANGGATWTRQDSWVSLPLFGVCFLDANRGWAVGWDGVLATADGGGTWQSQPLAISTVLSGVSFADAKHGWAVDLFGRVIATRTGGAPDTVGPVTYAKAASGKRGKYITLKIKITDETSTQAYDVRLTIKRGSKTVAKYVAYQPLKTGVWYAVKWKPAAKGTYTYTVRAKDKAGNKQSKTGSAKVVVR
ncbi:MAG: YCF48-related protein [Thermoleophilia bacterium]